MSGATHGRGSFGTQNCSSFDFFSGIAGSYVTEEQAAKAHDLATLKYWGTGPNTKLNFNVRIERCLEHTDMFRK